MNRKTLFKVGCGGVAVAGIAAAILFDVINQNNIHQFNGENLSPQDYEFMSYVTEYGKNYETKDEYKLAAARWAETDKAIKEYNAGAAGGRRRHSWTRHNRFSSYSRNQWKKLRGYNHSLRTSLPPLQSTLSSVPIANEVDWVTQGKVTPVQDQGQCGSCWSFSASGAISTARAVAGHPLVTFSEQQLVDCDTSSNGCNGGLMDYAFSYTETHPLEPISDYPYTASDGSCHYSSSKGTGSISSYYDVPKTATGLKQALNLGAVSVAIEADQPGFQYYAGGVLTSSECGTNLDHGVLAVGYGVDSESGLEYALVKNSWGSSWGAGGYVKIGLADNACGILNAASYPIV